MKHYTVNYHWYFFDSKKIGNMVTIHAACQNSLVAAHVNDHTVMNHISNSTSFLLSELYTFRLIAIKIRILLIHSNSNINFSFLLNNCMQAMGRDK